MQKQLFYILGLLVVLVVVAFMMTQKEASETASIQKNELFLDGLNDGQIKLVKIENAQGVLSQIEQGENGFHASHLAEGKPFNIDQDAFTSFIRDLASSKKLEAKSALEKNHARLGLLDINKDASTATIIHIEMDNKIFDVLVGNRANNQEGQFVRYNDDPQMWLIDTEVSLPTTQYDWLRKDIILLEQEELLSVARNDIEDSFSLINSSSELARSEDETSDWQLSAFDEANEELRFSGALSDYIDVILNLEFDSVAPFSALTWSAKEKFTTIILNDKNGNIHTLEIVEEDDKFLLHVTGQGEQAELNSWVFEIDSFQANELNKTRSDFLVQQASDTAEISEQ